MEVVNHFITGAGDILLGYGLQGVVMASSWFCTYKVYQRLCYTQDARTNDALTMTNAINSNTAAMNRIADGLLSNKH